MSDDWQVGDLAVCVNAGRCPKCDGNGTLLTNLVEGSSYTIAEIFTDDLGLLFDLKEIAPHPWRSYCAEHFRKIRPDEHQSCEPEFITLLKRGKRRVSA